MARKKASGKIRIETITQEEIEMLMNVTAGLGVTANKTWAPFGGQGYENAGVNPTVDNVNVIAYSCTIDKLTCATPSALGAGKTVPITLYKSTDKGVTWSATTLTTTLDDTHSTNTDNTHTVTFAQGDWCSLGYATTNAGATKNYFSSVRVTTL